jgi:hypothetical protein
MQISLQMASTMCLIIKATIPIKVMGCHGPLTPMHNRSQMTSKPLKTLSPYVDGGTSCVKNRFLMTCIHDKGTLPGLGIQIEDCGTNALIF